MAVRAVVALVESAGGATGAFIPVETEPEKVFNELSFIAGFGTLKVGVLNPQDEPAAGDAANVPPERPMLAPRAVAVGVALPQVPMILGLAATTTPVGRL